MNYLEASKLLNGRSSKVIKNNTVLHNAASSCIKLRFYETDILTYTKSYCVINTSGNRSRTTLKRINEYLPKGYSISQVKGEWIWNYSKPFEDGDKIILRSNPKQ
jgi:hypothetical protein